MEDLLQVYLTDEQYNDLIDSIAEQTDTLSNVINIQFAVLIAVLIFLMWRLRRRG